MSDHYILTLYTTVSGEAEARKLIARLLDEKLIACGVSWPAHSQYRWKDETVQEKEHVVFMKSSARVKEILIQKAEEYHPYEVPALLIHKTPANESYFLWVEGEVRT